MASLRLRLPVLGFAALLLVEFLLFDQLGAKHHTHIYPRWNDQIQYLTEAYTGYETARAQGLFHGLQHALTNPSAQGTLHDVWAILLFSVVGPSRSAALSLNMLLFLLWQAGVFAWLKVRFRSYTLAFAGAALLLLLRSPWMVAPGSAFDFRLDWMTVCWVGVALIALEWTSHLKKILPCCLFGAAVGVAIATRFLTATYFLTLFIALMMWCSTATQRSQRWQNLAYAGLIAAVIAGPVFWINRVSIYNYYVIGHFSGPESSLRQVGLGLIGSIGWILETFLFQHMGGWFIGTAVAALIAATIGAIVAPRRPGHTGFSPYVELPFMVPAALLLLIPLGVLSLHVQKSEQVVGVALAGGVGILLHSLARLWLGIDDRFRKRLSMCLVTMSLGYFATTMARDPHPESLKTDSAKTAALTDYIFNRSREAQLEAPRVAVDRVTDNLDAQILRVICYERHRRWIPFSMTLPTGIQEADTSLYWDRLKSSDFVILTAEGDSGRWPYDRQLAQLRGETLPWAHENLRHVEEFSMSNLRMELFERRDLR